MKKLLLIVIAFVLSLSSISYAGPKKYKKKTKRKAEHSKVAKPAKKMKKSAEKNDHDLDDI